MRSNVATSTRACREFAEKSSATVPFQLGVIMPIAGVPRSEGNFALAIE